jgi:hypothetical protein
MILFLASLIVGSEPTKWVTKCQFFSIFFLFERTKFTNFYSFNFLFVKKQGLFTLFSKKLVVLKFKSKVGVTFTQ